MLTYLLSGAVALAVGTAGGFLGSRLSLNGLRRDHVAALQGVDRVADDLRRDIGERPARGEVATRSDVETFLSWREEGLAQRFVTREEVQPLQDQQLAIVRQLTATRQEVSDAFTQVATRQELELAIQSVVSALAPNGALPRPQPALVQSAADNQAELARVLANLNQQMNGINQQLGLGGN
jgi:hypothetical protein